MNNKIQVLGKSAKFQEVLRTIGLVSVTDVPVLLSGETGTGKELLAQKIHASSRRKNREFVSVNCAALPQDFAESMLFGHKAGAFEGAAKSNQGYIAQAGSGTLFLDEISELPLPVQVKLQHFLESGEIQAVGSSAPRKCDARLLVATNKNLNDEVSAGKFRADLFYRLNVIPVELPALRDREGDVTILIEHFFRQLVSEQHQAAPNFTQTALKQITQYDWPGNIRELHNFCERMFILFSGKEVDLGNLPYELRSYSSSSTPFCLPAAGIKLEMVEVDLIQQALQTTSGNKSRAARLLGLTRDTFLYRLKKYSIDS